MQTAAKVEIPKIISSEIYNGKLVIDCKVKQNSLNEIKVTNWEMIAKVEGAELKNDLLQIFIPGDQKKMVNHKIVIEMK